MINKQILKDSLGWGLILWLIGYILGFIFYFVFPPNLMGWFIIPIGLVITFWVLLKKIKSNILSYYLMLAAVWFVIAVCFDYFFIVKMLKPIDGYYKPDVYLYYSLTFLVPLAVGWWKKQNLAKH